MFLYDYQSSSILIEHGEIVNGQYKRLTIYKSIVEFVEKLELVNTYNHFLAEYDKDNIGFQINAIVKSIACLEPSGLTLHYSNVGVTNVYEGVEVRQEIIDQTKRLCSTMQRESVTS
jgi:hypothetical protein